MPYPFSLFSEDDNRNWERQQRLKDQMRVAGFSTRACNNLPRSLPIADLTELQTGQWEDEGDVRGLRWHAGNAPGCGPQVLAEVEAYRAGQDPREARAPGPVRVSVAFELAEMAALDAWIATQPTPTSRHDAIRAFVAAGLNLIGRE